MVIFDGTLIVFMDGILILFMWVCPLQALALAPKVTSFFSSICYASNERDPYLHKNVAWSRGIIA